MRALIVDDSRAMRRIIGDLLRDMGAQVFEAANGREALERLPGLAPLALVLVDWNMPEMNGLELVRAVRAQPIYDEMRLVMVTTESDQARVSLALEAGANEYVM